jgi:hypothetical protein
MLAQPDHGQYLRQLRATDEIHHQPKPHRGRPW